MTTPSGRRARDAGDLRRSPDTHREIKGRRWRLSDPALDEPVHQHLVGELMDARRAVKAALRTQQADERDDPLAATRSRVHDAKVALGERGPAWWEPMTHTDIDVRVEAFVRAIGGRLGDVDEHRAASLLHLSPPT